jgi:translation initiation factor IF-3
MNKMNINTKPRNIKKNDGGVRKNSDIRYPEIRLLGKDRTQLGIMSVSDALIKAASVGLDLIELSPDAKPPVCFLGSAEKFIYEKNKDAKKREKDQKKLSKSTAVKEIKFRPNIAEGDALRKLNDVTTFLSQGHRVKITMQFRGRERARIVELSARLTSMVMEHINNGKIEGTPNKTFNQHTITLVPINADVKGSTDTEV